MVMSTGIVTGIHVPSYSRACDDGRMAKRRGPEAKKPLTAFGERLERALRLSGRFDGNLTALAEAAGSSYRTVYNYMRTGTAPPSDLVKRLADELGVTTDDLLGAGRATHESHVVREDERNEIVEQVIREERASEEAARRLRPLVKGYGGRPDARLVVGFLGSIEQQLRREAAGEPDPAPRELPPVPEGRRRVPPGRRGRS